MVSMDLLLFEICFGGLSVTEEQLFNKSIMTGNSILRRMVCCSRCMLFVAFIICCCQGFMLLGGRLRDISERQLISEVIKKHFERDVNVEQLFGFDGSEGGVTTREILKLLFSHSLVEFSHLVWTDELVQMAVLVYRAVQFNEPVLLVGNTGYVFWIKEINVVTKAHIHVFDVRRCGKTTLCQFLACLLRRQLFTINCHLHTEAADFLGGLRPVRKQSQGVC